MTNINPPVRELLTTRRERSQRHKRLILSSRSMYIMHIYLVYVALAFTSLVAGSARAFNPNKRQALSDNSSTFHFTNSSTSTRLNSTNMIARSLIVSTNSSADTNHSSSANSTLGVSIWTGPSCKYILSDVSPLTLLQV